jgi:hypothetical protein
MKYAYKDEHRFGLNSDEVNAYMQGAYDQYLSYADCNAIRHVRQPNQKTVIVSIKYIHNYDKGMIRRILESIQGIAIYKHIDHDCDQSCLDNLSGLEPVINFR